ncbi:MAG: glycosyltransferase family 9 protein, partial [Dehalococcoidia bacterium]|nr:glycosyltransferase family 9 protein [Dehalococcoidia bacterium]
MYPSSPLRAAAPRRVAVFRALQLGDLLCAVPAVRALRSALPEASITLIGLPWATSFAARFSHLVDAFLPFPGAPGLPEQPASPADLDAFCRRARLQAFDLAVQLHGDGSVTNAVVGRLGARVVAGFSPPNAGPSSDSFLPYPDNGHEIRRLLDLVVFLGAHPRGEQLEFPLYAADQAALHYIPAAAGLRFGRYAVLHPGARDPGRRWPPDAFAAAGDDLARRGLDVVLTGTESEVALGRAVAARMTAPATLLAGQTSLGALGALVAGAALLVSNDTGVSHVAAALRTRSVVLFTTSDPRRWAPLD